MHIKKKYIRSADNYLSPLKMTNKVKLVFTVKEPCKKWSQRVGFSENPYSGETVLPSRVGSVTTFNADGKYENLKELPKEDRYLYTIEWSWKQWAGRGQTETVTEHRDVYKPCYQRKFIEPPSLELSWIEKDECQYIVSSEINPKTATPEEFKHAINLFLELFGECEIRRDDLSTFTPPQIKRVNWEMLPPGKYPWDKAIKHTKNIVNGKDARHANVILDRQETVCHYEPDEVYGGKGGFHSYLAYVFKEKNIVVLESLLTGNATYIFDDDWRAFSKLTKAEILNNKLQKDRLIHSNGWQNRLQNLLEPESTLI